MIVIAALGIFLAFTGSQSPEGEKAPKNDQESGLSHGSSITPASRPPVPTSWPSYANPADSLAADSGPPPENGPTPDEGLTPEDGLTPEKDLAPEEDLAPKQIKARPRPVPSPSPGIGEALPPPARRDSATPSGPAGRTRAPRSVPTPPKSTDPEPAAPATVSTAQPTLATAQAPRTSASTQRPAPSVPLGTDPCATFLDFRRDYCYRLLGR
ncbi:hypothetical protein AB0L53_40745 [Nonomuraea sp. NPDC052129]|uniref:hypothetical protein n=1 Tax=Nonomuraea sp. NPDC052129 TaxID=3154651 RepID=UPI00344043CE